VLELCGSRLDASKFWGACGFCLAEAKRDSVREFLKSASVIAIHQDSRKGRLAIRVSAANPNLQTLYGFLGSADLASEFSLDAVGIRNATLMVGGTTNI
jgi:hypothetical protein